MGKDTGSNRKQGRGASAPQQAAPQAAPQGLSPEFVKAKAAEENGVKLRGAASSLVAGQQVYVKKRPNNLPAGPDPWRLRDKKTGAIVAVAKDSSNLLAFANALALEVVSEK